MESVCLRRRLTSQLGQKTLVAMQGCRLSHLTGDHIPGSSNHGNPQPSFLGVNEKNLVVLGYIGDYTTHLYGDYSKPL